MTFTVRTIDEIFQSLLTDKQTLDSLNALVPGGITDENTLRQTLTDSRVAEWVKELYTNADLHHVTDLRTESAITDIDTIIVDQKVGTDKWLIEEALKFQVDYSLIIDPVTNQISYSEIDEDAQIIGSCTISQPSRTVFIKVRRKDTNILTNDEFTQFENYISKDRFSGTDFIVENFDGDLFTLNLTIIYDGLVDLTTVTSDTEDAVTSYLNNLNSDSNFITSQMIDALQQLTFIIDPRFDSGSAITSLGAEESFVHEYKTSAGWGQINPATPLSGSITYIAR